ncbi:MAG TPA: DUF2058 family protein [Dokdonella sp.]|uniref:DUF2058 family protein n=1 Tax=Dokdonella sp. TaxID=2291710 RepID=UPI002D805F61|nr:DUF2058 family protein [Dokdonella sp.]HET9032279.1 DUF2058 family protein [Dokdonella sp.]
MADSLRDQLLKSGLVSKLKAQAKPANRPPRSAGKKRSATRPPTGAAPKPARNQEEIDLARAYGLRDRAEREQRDLEKKQAEQRAKEKAERKQKLAALLAGKALNRGEAEIARHFPHGDKIRRVYCTAEQLVQVNAGELAIVQQRGRYLLVTREIGEQVGEISAEALILLCDPDAPAEDDVPADLIW